VVKVQPELWASVLKVPLGAAGSAGAVGAPGILGYCGSDVTEVKRTWNSSSVKSVIREYRYLTKLQRLKPAQSGAV
jgi:hypothetical protein